MASPPSSHYSSLEEEDTSADECMPNVKLLDATPNQTKGATNGDNYSDEDDDISRDEEEEISEEEVQRPKTSGMNEQNGSQNESAGQSGDPGVSQTILTTEEGFLLALNDIYVQPATTRGVMEEVNSPQKLYVKMPDGIFLELTEEEIAGK